jgi:hypothetical protein
VDVSPILIRMEISVNRVLARGGGKGNSYSPHLFYSASLFIFNIYVTLPPRFFNSWVHVSKHNTVEKHAETQTSNRLASSLVPIPFVDRLGALNEGGKTPGVRSFYNI